jgi:hypothetical protein
MKKIIFLLYILLLNISSFAQNPSLKTIDPAKKVLTVEASCGQCQFKMAGKGCTLAVRIDGKAYFVNKAHIDDFGDAHGKMGFCNAIRKAKVQGEVVDGKFMASYFEIIEPK